MMAIISDLHANIEAMQAVIDDIEKKGIEDIVVLGDVIGYGPNPVECLEMVRQLKPKAILLGNHEDALLNGCPDNMAPRAQTAIDWTREQLSKSDIDFIKTWKTRYDIGPLMAVHASPRSHVLEYIFPLDISNRQRMLDIFSHIPGKHCVVGHVHIPGVFTEDFQFISPNDLMSNLYLFGDEKAIINVGSVGQPRDLDRRSCYITFDGEAVVFRRVEYDFRKTQRKILALPEFDPFLAKRLEVGR